MLNNLHSIKYKWINLPQLEYTQYTLNWEKNHGEKLFTNYKNCVNWDTVYKQMYIFF